MLQLLEKICQILESLGIPYMLSGSVAMNFYTDPRTTRDIDRRKIQYFGIDLWIIRLEDLVISKLKWIQVLESEKQKNDIVNLLDVFYIDMEYIMDWCKQLNLKTYQLL
jgi:hypothetical protein